MTEDSSGPVLITGGAGFIGTNLAHRLAGRGIDVTIYDNLARPGVESNLSWLRKKHGSRIRPVLGDIRDADLLRNVVRDSSAVFHLAAQVAVTTSLIDPITDFEVNARGTLNLLEALRALPAPPPLVFTSTNKVLGGLERIRLIEERERYEPADSLIRKSGINEDWGIDFCSPYGCSKGAADQYVLDYSRSFGLRAVVFRMSCVYGPHQFGTEDQGWVAHFVKRAVENSPITFFGDGKQVRDALFVEDLVDAFEKAISHIDTITGNAFNIGGGPANSMSLRELVYVLGRLKSVSPAVIREGWRPSDQRYYVSDTGRFRSQSDWSPKVGVEEGVTRLYEWMSEAVT